MPPSGIRATQNTAPSRKLLRRTVIAIASSQLEYLYVPGARSRVFAFVKHELSQDPFTTLCRAAGQSPDYPVSVSGERIYRQKLISRNRLKYSLKRLRFPGRRGERNALNSYDKECPFLLPVSLLEKNHFERKTLRARKPTRFFLPFNFAK